MREHTFPFRWLLPAAQLSLCFIALWPSRYFILFQISHAIARYAPVRPGKTSTTTLNIQIHTLTAEQQAVADRAHRFEDLMMHAPQALNFPVCFVQVPFIMARQTGREWTPDGFMKETWRGISWPFVGVFFWWIIGRSVEALISIRKGTSVPRVTLAETIFAALMIVAGIGTLVGIITSTPDDRQDLQFVGLMVGGMLWGILASITIAARVLQWKIRNKATLVSA